MVARNHALMSLGIYLRYAYFRKSESHYAYNVEVKDVKENGTDLSMDFSNHHQNFQLFNLC